MFIDGIPVLCRVPRGQLTYFNDGGGGGGYEWFFLGLKFWPKVIF